MDKATVSAYLTVRCGKLMDYPFEESIRSCLSFADEVVVVDSSDKDDGTMEALEALMDEDERIQVYHLDVPWDAPNYGIYDGQTKAFAREQCTADFLWQQDVDEVAESSTKQKLETLLPKLDFLTEGAFLVAMPVIEYWGGQDKVRIDVNPWKWRLSRKGANITHGIPVSHRWYKDGLLYARPGTDGCDYIDINTGKPVPCVHFVTKESEQIRQMAIKDESLIQQYQTWLQAATTTLPTVHHFSWWSIASKIKKYKHFWNDSWLTLYGEKQTKPEGWNPFFPNKSLDQVSDKEIDAKAKELATGTGGHIFHTAFVPGKTSPTNAVKLDVELPELIKPWCKKHEV